MAVVDTVRGSSRSTLGYEHGRRLIGGLRGVHRLERWGHGRLILADPFLTGPSFHSLTVTVTQSGACFGGWELGNHGGYQYGKQGMIQKQLRRTWAS